LSLLASLKTATNSKDCSEIRIRISDPTFLCCPWSIFFSSVHVKAGFQNNFQNHSRLSEQLLESRGYLPESRNSFLKIVSRKIFRISLMISKKQAESLCLIFSLKTKRHASKFSKNHQR
jgi:hypothetical protein